jgi:hydrogenase maturation protease
MEGDSMIGTPGEVLSAPRARLLVAGIGNIFFGDDAFGVEVAQRLAGRPQQDGVKVVDFGIRGLDLAYSLLDDYEVVILVDAAPRGGHAGTLYVLEPELSPAEGVPMLETHSMDPVRVLRLVESLGGRVRRLVVVGCEPARSDEEDFASEMSAPVRAAVDEAIPLVELLIARLLSEESEKATGHEMNAIPKQEISTCQP